MVDLRRGFFFLMILVRVNRAIIKLSLQIILAFLVCFVTLKTRFRPKFSSSCHRLHLSWRPRVERTV